MINQIIFRQQQIKLHKHLNLITGNDGSGKEAFVKELHKNCNLVVMNKAKETIEELYSIYPNLYETDENCRDYLKIMDKILSAPAHHTVILNKMDNLDHNLKESLFDKIEEQENVQFIIISNDNWIINQIPPVYWFIVDDGVVRNSDFYHIPKSSHRAFFSLVDQLSVNDDRME